MMLSSAASRDGPIPQANAKVSARVSVKAGVAGREAARHTDLIAHGFDSNWLTGEIYHKPCASN